MNTNTQTLHTPNGTPIHAWKAPKNEHHERGTLWYASTSVFALLCLVYSIITGGWTFTIVIVLIAGIYALTHKHTPRIHDIHILEEGCRIDGDLIPFSTCQGFFILEGPGFAELHIERKNPSDRDIKLQITEIDPNDLHDTLNRYLEEFPDRHENILDFISRICKL